MAIDKEGPESSHVTDATKMSCPNCGGVKIMLSNLMDDPIDITGDTRFAALMIESDDPIMGLVGLCVQCGHEWVPIWYTIDTIDTDGTAMTCTAFNTDRNDGSGANATTNLCAGLYLICFVDGNADEGKYVTIATNTAADPAILTANAHTNTADGIWLITNVLPLGLTAR